MKYGRDILSHLNNIVYEAEQIQVLIRKQLEADGNTEINLDPCAIRFSCFGAIDTGAQMIQTYCEGIRANLKVAETKDNEFILKESANAISETA